MRRSLSYQLLLLFLLFALISHSIGFLLITYYLPDYYYERTKDRLAAEAEQVEILYREDQLTESVIDALIARVKGNLYLLDQDGRLLFSSLYVDAARGRGMGAMNAHLPSSVQLPEASDGSLFYEMVDGRNARWMIYVESQEDLKILFQVPTSDIEEPISTFQTFYLGLLLLNALIGVPLAILFSRRFTTPVRQLDELANALKNLQFDRRYEGQRDDELGRLGETFNVLASSLEETIRKLESELAKEKRIDRLRKRFIAQVSHELQTPIAIVKGYLEILQDGLYASTEERDQYHLLIQREMDAMSVLIEQMLQLSKYESGSMQLNRVSTSFPGFIKREVEKFFPLAEEKSITFSYRLDATCTVFVDPERMVQVVNNLMRNAIEHTRESGEIRISCREENGWAFLEVFNEGKAIDEKDLLHVFDSFYKREGKSTGTGLGLAIVREIITLHGGRYGVKNAPGGVAFYIGLKAE